MFSRLALFSLFATLVSSTVTNCAVGKSLFTINSQGFAPDPPIVGQNATLWIDYSIPEGISVSAGTAKYSMTFNGVPLPTSVKDLCTQIVCPQVNGTHNISSASIWNGGASGKIVSKIEWFDSSNTLLLCSQTTIKIKTDDLADIFDSSSSGASSSLLVTLPVIPLAHQTRRVVPLMALPMVLPVVLPVTQHSDKKKPNRSSLRKQA